MYEIIYTRHCEGGARSNLEYHARILDCFGLRPRNDGKNILLRKVSKDI
ncbi:MAG: hypothetical protein Greene101415_2 [Parcubacteria group bacterium Greene1014_15]|nr:MAG: hypothetical protein Greene101415_2 [Parcubacteria group bacterium Greene1014_15]